MQNCHFAFDLAFGQFALLLFCSLLGWRLSGFPVYSKSDYDFKNSQLSFYDNWDLKFALVHTIPSNTFRSTFRCFPFNFQTSTELYCWVLAPILELQLPNLFCPDQIAPKRPCVSVRSVAAIGTVPTCVSVQSDRRARISWVFKSYWTSIKLTIISLSFIHATRTYYGASARPPRSIIG